MKNLNFIIAGISFMILGCSSHNNIVSVSETHAYNEDFGFLKSYSVDIPTEINPEWTMELTKDTDAFYAHEYVQKEDVITYKYKFDTKFYDHAEWRQAEY